MLFKRQLSNSFELSTYRFQEVPLQRVQQSRVRGHADEVPRKNPARTSSDDLRVVLPRRNLLLRRFGRSQRPGLQDGLFGRTSTDPGGRFTFRYRIIEIF
jgi:hypothetical protein